jgi:large subunit ribosomal protein L25
VKTYGGILEHTSREVEILCLPAEIPPHFDVDVSKLMVGDSIHVSDLPRGNWEFLTEAVRVVAQVTAPTVEKVETTEAAATADAAATPAEEGKSEGAPAKGEASKPAKGAGGKS